MRFLTLLALFFVFTTSFAADAPKPAAKKMYWLIAGGLRADTANFNVFKWAREGKLPNIKRMLEEGAAAYSVPDFPSQDATNFATLLTGTHPSVHGVSDTLMHSEGSSLDRPSALGFASSGRKIPALWKLADSAGKKSYLLSVPGSTPPEIRETTIRGRWGGWGGDATNIVFQSEGKRAAYRLQGRGFSGIYPTRPLTKFVTATPSNPKEKTSPLKSVLSVHNLDINAVITKSASSTGYNRMQFFLGGDTPVADLSEGQWSLWIPVVLQGQDIEIPTEFKIKIIKIWPDGNFRVKVLFNTLNRYISSPASAAEFLARGVGQMVDYADSSPQQLIFEPEDKEAFEDEMRLSFEWHKKAVPFILERAKADIFVHSMFSPGQMLESRWWMRELDGAHKEDAAKDILAMYQEVDAVLGEAMKKAGKDTLVVLSADHGMCPLNKLVHLNNLFAKKGWLKFNVDKKTGDAAIDWKKTKVAFVNSHQIFVHPNGLAGEWKRAKGPAYEKLRNEVMKAVQGLKDEKGVKPVVHSVKWEDAKGVYDLPADRVGDLTLEARPGYAWDENVDKSKRVFSNSLTSGTSQAIDPKINSCLWTPFVMWGPGVKKGVEIAAPISHADQLPTFLQLLGIAAPEHIQGKVISEALN